MYWQYFCVNRSILFFHYANRKFEELNMSRNRKSCFAFVSMIILFVCVNQVSATDYIVVDLNPSGFSNCFAYGISGGQQVGYGPITGGNYHALLWSGSAASAVDLNPAGFNYSEANGIGGGQQVGYGYQTPTGGNGRAFLWSGSAASAVNLNPSGCDSSEAYGVSGGQQVGVGGWTLEDTYHAFLWRGSAASAVDINPAGFSYSEARGISGGQQVGFGVRYLYNYPHALLWNGTAASAVDLNPSGFRESYAFGIGGGHQVGFGSSTTGGYSHALLWSGTAAIAVDLHQFLPAAFKNSCARSIDDKGDIVGYAIDSAYNYHAILWQPVPEPATFVMLGMAALVLTFVWRRKRAG